MSFVNNPCTDFTLRQNGIWAVNLVSEWQPLCDSKAPDIPLEVNGDSLIDDRPVSDCTDPSRPGVVVGRYRRAREPARPAS